MSGYKRPSHLGRVPVTIRWHRTNARWVVVGGGNRQMFPSRGLAYAYVVGIAEAIVARGALGAHVRVYERSGELALSELLPPRGGKLHPVEQRWDTHAREPE